MSFSPVRGRSSAVASVWIRCLYLSSICIETTAIPFWSLTPPISPICTPETRTVWPWPGVTACAVENSALSVNGVDWMNGKRKRSLLRMYPATRRHDRATIAAKSPVVLIARFIDFPRPWARCDASRLAVVS